MAPSEDHRARNDPTCIENNITIESATAAKKPKGILEREAQQALHLFSSLSILLSFLFYYKYFERIAGVHGRVCLLFC